MTNDTNFSGANDSQIMDGIKVLDLTRVLAGPWCTQTLAEMGADVYKIERPGTGDEMRSPPYLNKADGTPTNETAPFILVNRGKRSLTVDFRKPEGHALLRKLADECDVIVENFKVGDLKRFGLDYESVAKSNPNVVYCSITGYGQDGPMAAWPGYDPVLQALSGMMSATGIPDGEPSAGPLRTMVPLVDVMAGITATTAIVSALFHRFRRGRGQYIDIALLDVAIAATAHHTQTYMLTGRLPTRVGNGSLLFSPSNCYPCRDGLALIQVGNDAQWIRLCEVIGCSEWTRDERFGTNGSRVSHARELDRMLGEVTRAWHKLELVQRLGEAGVPCGAVNSIEEALAHPQVVHRGLRQAVLHPALGMTDVIRNPMRFSHTAMTTKSAPTLGQHTDEVLSDVLGMSPSEIASLKCHGVI